MKQPKKNITQKFEDLLLYGRHSLLWLWLPGLLVLLAVAVGLRLWVNHQFGDPIDPAAGEPGEALWRALIESLNLASLGKEEPSSLANRLVGVFTAFLGGLWLIFGVVGTTARLVLRLHQRKEGQGEFQEVNHTLILGFGEQTVDVVRELIEASRFRQGASIVILSEQDPDRVMEQLQEGMQSFGNTKILCRRGNVASPYGLARLGVERARSVILVNPALAWEHGSIKNQGDSTVTLAIMAVVSACTNNIPNMTVKMHYKRNLQVAQGVAKGKLFAIEEDEILAKIMVQASRSPGLSRVYSNLVGFVGNEVYFFNPSSPMAGKTFGELAFHFLDTIPLGVRHAHGSVELNPSREYVLEPGDQLVVLAEDEQKIRFFDRPVIEPRELTSKGQRQAQKPEHYLIYGWNKKTPKIIAEYASYLPAGSVVNLVVPDMSERMERHFKEMFKQYPNLQLGLGQVNPGAEDFPEKLQPERYKAVVLLSSEGDNPQEVDSVTFNLLLRFRSYFQERTDQTGKAPKTQLLAETQQTKNAQLMQAAGVKNLMVSNQILSKIQAQVSEEPEILQVYEDLFRAEGSEIYLKPVELFLEELDSEVYFADLMLAAQKRGEVCFGIWLKRLEDSAEDNFGLLLLPNKTQTFWVTYGDRLVTLAPDNG